jgi:CxxC motif-containing protein
MSDHEPSRGAAPGDITLVCIACPIGCRLTVHQAPPGGAAFADVPPRAAPPGGAVFTDVPGRATEQEVTVTGNRCPKGESYGREEILSPRRTVTAVVPTDSEDFPCAPVRTDGSIPRGQMRELLQKLYAGKARLPVRMGDVYIPDFNGTRIIFTRTLPPDDVPSVGKAGAEAEGDH